MEKMILLYSYPNDLNRKVSEVCLRFGISCKKIPRKRFSQKIGNHVGAPGFENTGEIYEGDDLSEPIMLFAGINPNELDVVMDELKASGVRTTGFKAIVTMYNINWNIFDLFEELYKERSAMTGNN